MQLGFANTIEAIIKMSIILTARYTAWEERREIAHWNFCSDF